MLTQASLRAFAREQFFSDEHLARECGANAAVKGLLQPRFWVRTSCSLSMVFGAVFTMPASRTERVPSPAWLVSKLSVA